MAGGTEMLQKDWIGYAVLWKYVHCHMPPETSEWIILPEVSRFLRLKQCCLQNVFKRKLISEPCVSECTHTHTHITIFRENSWSFQNLTYGLIQVYSTHHNPPPPPKRNKFSKTKQFIFRNMEKEASNIRCPKIVSTLNWTKSRYVSQCCRRRQIVSFTLLLHLSKDLAHLSFSEFTRATDRPTFRRLTWYSFWIKYFLCLISCELLNH
jgi:hypothetical protein